jgi:hypothetical protein
VSDRIVRRLTQRIDDTDVRGAANGCSFRTPELAADLLNVLYLQKFTQIVP